MLLAAIIGVRAGADGWDFQLPHGFPSPRIPPDNPLTSAKIELGRYLFYDTRLSGNDTQACATCHRQARAFTDGRARAVGSTGQVHPRGSMSLVNVAFASALTWGNPNLRRLEDQTLIPMFGTDPIELGMTAPGDALVSRLELVPIYARLFADAFPTDPSPITVGHVTQALASFERTIMSGSSPYDRYHFAREDDAISSSAKRGEVLFFSQPLSCFRCHGGFNFSGAVAIEAGGPRPPEFSQQRSVQSGGHALVSAAEYGHVRRDPRPDVVARRAETRGAAPKSGPLSTHETVDVMADRALTPAASNPDLRAARARLDELESTLAQREAALATFKAELRDLQDAYLDKMGTWQSQLAEIDAAVADAEIRAGLRPPTETIEPDDDDDDESGRGEDPSSDRRACASRPSPTDDLRRIFRDVAKMIHPDLGPNDPSRYRRHSLMAEANRAYANRDEDRLRLILRAWERSADVLPDDGADAMTRVRRQIAEIEARVVAIDMEFADLRRSAIWQLKLKIDEARAQGWDLFAEMVMHIRREIGRASARLAVLQRL